MRAQPVLEAAHYLPLVFEGLGVLDTEFEGEKGDHSVVGRWSFVGGQTLAPTVFWRTTNDERPTTLLRHHFRRNPFRHECFNDIANFDVAVVGDRDAAFHAICDLAGVIFEAAQ